MNQSESILNPLSSQDLQTLSLTILSSVPETILLKGDDRVL